MIAVVDERTFPMANLFVSWLAVLLKRTSGGTYIARSKNMMTPPIRKKPPEIYIRAARLMNATLRALSPTTGAKGNPDLYVRISIRDTTN